MAHEAVIGLECHIQLRSRTKMFCECRAAFGAKPNSNVCPVCLGLPGALPRANRVAVEAALRLGLALGCTVRQESVFARKNYFYPDMPKNYQITQYERPLCEGGALPVEVHGTERTFEISRIHLEEDTGKSFHPERRGERPVSRVDFNRAGVPLLELVTRPTFREPGECGAFLTTLRRLVRWLGVSEGDMEKGHLRCDANVSLRPAGTAGLGVKTELKNLNSIKGVEKGLRAEIARQRGILESGGSVEQATLLFDAEQDRLVIMRSKEDVQDYRYFPEPDLPPLRVDEEWLRRAREGLPELPWVRVARFQAEHGLRAEDARVLCEQRDVADYFDEVARAAAAPRRAAGWIMTEVLRRVRELGAKVEDARDRLPAGRLAFLIAEVEAKRVTAATAKSVLEESMRTGADPREILAARGAAATGSPEELAPLVRQVLEEHPAEVARYLGGRSGTLGFLVGQVVKRSGGRALPQVVRRLLLAELEARGGPGA